jgi:hypothetical protein
VIEGLTCLIYYVILEWFILYNVGSTWPLCVTGLHYLSLLNTNGNVLGYWRHRSVCYTSLFTTSLVVTTVSVYNVFRPSDIVSRSGSFICSVISFSVSSLLFSSLLCFSSLCSLFYLSSLLCVSSLSLSSISLLWVLSLSVSLSLYLLPLKYSICVWERRHLPPRLHFPLLRFPTVGCLGILST